MKLLIFFFSFLLITISLMAKEPLLSELEKSPLIVESGYNYFDFEFRITKVVCKTNLSTSQIISISNNLSYFVMHSPHSYIKGYRTGQSNIILEADATKYIVTTNWEKINFNLIFFGEPLFYGKAPPYD